MRWLLKWKASGALFTHCMAGWCGQVEYCCHVMSRCTHSYTHHEISFPHTRVRSENISVCRRGKLYTSPTRLRVGNHKNTYEHILERSESILQDPPVIIQLSVHDGAGHLDNMLSDFPPPNQSRPISPFLHCKEIWVHGGRHEPSDSRGRLA